MSLPKVRLATRLLLVLVLALAAAYLAPASPGGAAAGGRFFTADDVFPTRDPRAAAPAMQYPQAVLADDERVQITETNIYPWRAIAQLELYDSARNLLGTCTGTFVGADAVLTAGHCLYDSEKGAWTGDIAVVPGKNGSAEPYGYQFASNWWVADQYISSGGDFLYDWGIIKMPDATLGDTVGWLSVANMTTDTLSRDDFKPAIAGYPGDKPDGTMWAGVKPAFLSVDQDRLHYDIDTAPGQSGSAIFSANLDAPFVGYVAGIHTQGGETENSGSRIDQELLDDLLTGCREMACTLDYVVEPGEPPTVTPTPPPPLERVNGDDDCDGDVDSVDGLKDLRQVAGLLVTQTEPCPDIGGPSAAAADEPATLGDVDCDGDVDSVDGLKILRHVAGLNVTQTEPCADIGT